MAHLRACHNLLNGASRTRTGDLLGAIQALFQLSYSPEGEGRGRIPVASQGKDTRMGFGFPATAADGPSRFPAS